VHFNSLLVGNVGRCNAKGQFSGYSRELISPINHDAEITIRLTAWKDKHFFNQTIWRNKEYHTTSGAMVNLF